MNHFVKWTTRVVSWKHKCIAWIKRKRWVALWTKSLMGVRLTDWERKRRKKKLKKKSVSRRTTFFSHVVRLWFAVWHLSMSPPNFLTVTFFKFERDLLGDFQNVRENLNLPKLEFVTTLFKVLGVSLVICLGIYLWILFFGFIAPQCFFLTNDKIYIFLNILQRVHIYDFIISSSNL